MFVHFNICKMHSLFFPKSIYSKCRCYTKYCAILGVNKSYVNERERKIVYNNLCALIQFTSIKVPIIQLCVHTYVLLYTTQVSVFSIYLRLNCVLCTVVCVVCGVKMLNVYKHTNVYTFTHLYIYLSQTLMNECIICYPLIDVTVCKKQQKTKQKPQQK